MCLENDRYYKMLIQLMITDVTPREETKVFLMRKNKITMFIIEYIKFRKKYLRSKIIWGRVSASVS